MNKPGFSLLDCTLRDGGYINNWDFSFEFIVALYKASVQSGVDIFEVGYLSLQSNSALCQNIPSWLTKQLKSISSTPAIAAMLDGKNVGIPLSAPEDSGIDILRVALKKGEFESKKHHICSYYNQGYKIFIQLMGITNYSDLELLTALKQIESEKCVHYINIGDSYGSLLPDKTKHIISLLKNNTSLKVGLHAHNNMQLGMANALAAIEAGADLIDGSILGMGRGGGNIPLELLVTYFERLYPSSYKSLPLLEFIDREMPSITEKYRWGYSLEALISGVYECHPYFTSRLIQKREYTIEQILKTAQIINENKITDFSDKILESIIECGFIKNKFELKQNVDKYINKNKQKVTYANRYRDKKFLILANGPSLTLYKKDIEKYIAQNDPVILGANNLDNHFLPTYHAFTNQKRFEQYIDTVSPKSHLLIGDSIVAPSQISNKAEKIYFFNSSETPFDIQDGIITCNCRSVSILLGAVALIMGAETIAYAGADGYLINGNTMFYQEDDSTNPKDILEKHNKNQLYLSQLISYASSRNVAVFPITPSTYKFE